MREEYTISSPAQSIAEPQKSYSARAQVPRKNSLSDAKRQRVLEFYHRLCVYCWYPAETVDHVIPYSYGGTDDDDNLVAACSLCNRLGSNLVFDDFDEKRLYIWSILMLPRYQRRRKLSFCIDCHALFRVRWKGSTAFLCSACNARDLAKDGYGQ